MPHVAGHDNTIRFNLSHDGFQHWKYPETLGSDTNSDDIN